MSGEVVTFTHEWTKDGGRTKYTFFFFFFKVLVVEIAIPFLVMEK